MLSSAQLVKLKYPVQDVRLSYYAIVIFEELSNHMMVLKDLAIFSLSHGKEKKTIKIRRDLAPLNFLYLHN